MQVYNFEKIKENINIELRDREVSNKRKYNYQCNIYEKRNINTYLDLMYSIENDDEIAIRYIEDKSIGFEEENIYGNLRTIIDMEFKYNTFKNCSLKNIKFTNCKFTGNIFDNCNFRNVHFENCDFYNTKDDISIFDNKTSFINCYFNNCHMEKSIFRDVYLTNIYFIYSNMKDIIFSGINMDNVCITDCDCRSFKIIEVEIKSFKFDDDYLTKFDEYTFIDNIKVDKNYKKTYEIASKVYRSFAYKFESNRLIDNSGEYYYLSKVMENKSLSGIKRFKSYIYWMLCGYGERPTYALITSLEIVLIFAIIYMLTGLNMGGYIIDYSVMLEFGIFSQNLISDFMKSLYFSIVTFTTVGYGDITPVGMSVFLSGVEMLLGVTMVGVWTATLARKITR